MKIKHPKVIVDVLVVGTIAAIIALYRLGAHTLNPIAIEWVLPFHDASVNLTGCLYFLNEPWIFPLGAIKGLLAPIGATIGYTDSAPIVAVFFKTINFLLPDNFHFLGWLHFLNHVLQVVVAYFLISKITSQRILKILAAFFFLYSYVFLFRYMHCSLTSQWVILLAYIYYLSSSKEVGVFRYLLYSFIITGLAAGLHPYLGIMVLVIVWSAYFKETVIYKNMQTIQGIHALAGSFFIVILCWYLMGFFYFRGLAYAEYGFGIFSTNLNAFINSLGVSRYFFGLPIRFAGQYEGNAYLGLGVFVLISVNTINFIIRIIKKQNNYKLSDFNFFLPLFIVISFLALFSLSNIICFNEKVLFTIPFSQKLSQLLSTFRASGRFIWPLFYFIVFINIKILIKNFKAFTAIIIIILCLGLQISDFAIMQTPFKRIKTYDWRIDKQKWSELIQPFNLVISVPLYEETLLYENDWKELTTICAINNKPITMGALARYPKEQMSKYSVKTYKQISKNQFKKDSLYVFNPQAFKAFSQKGAVDLKCKNIDGYTVCSQDGIDF